MTYFKIWIIASLSLVALVVSVGVLFGHFVARKSELAEAIRYFANNWWRSIAALAILLPVGLIVHYVLNPAHNSILSPIFMLYLLLCVIGCAANYFSTWLGLNFGYIVGKYYTEQYLAKAKVTKAGIASAMAAGLFGSPARRNLAVKYAQDYIRQQEEISIMNADVTNGIVALPPVTSTNQ